MPSEPAAIGRAAANPTKEFFVSMLTRDISIEDCILDLIDNSVDAAWESEGGSLPGIEPSSRLDGYTVELTIDHLGTSVSQCEGGGLLPLVGEPVHVDQLRRIVPVTDEESEGASGIDGLELGEVADQ